MSAKVQKEETCHASNTDIQMLFNISNKKSEYISCKASELISKQYRIG